MILLSAENINKSFTEKPVLDDSSFFLEEGEKVGVIGINGTGKTTFLKILAGMETPDSGRVTLGGRVRIGYLPQNPEFIPGACVLQQVLRGAGVSSDAKEHEAKTILTKLGINRFDEDVATLSGGQKKRVAIASALMTPCEILILDEPTNHLDNDMICWLENYLIRYSGAIVMVTHDRYFLDRVTNRIVEIDHGKLYSYQSNYTKFLELKSEREKMQAATQRKLKTLLHRELEWAQRGARARGTKSQYRLDRIDELKDAQCTQENARLTLGSMASRLGKKIIEIEGVSKNYKEKTLFSDFSYILLRDDRIGIIGPNGCGKSTLLKVLCGQLEPDNGKVVIGDTVKIGYFSQEWEEMDPSQRVIEYIRGVAENIETPEGTLTASQMLEKFLFSGDLQWNTIGRLSGGERRRLYLCRVLMDAPNVLLLDEPTNDLDIETLMILEDYLEQFQGAVIAVSHDRYFLDKTAHRIFAFEQDGKIQPYEGGYTDYSHRSSQRQGAEKIEKITKEEKEKQYPRQRKLKFSYKEEREFETIDEDIAAMEEKICQLDQEIEAQGSDYQKLQELLDKKKELSQQLEEKLERWTYLNELAEKIAAQEVESGK
ncbi:ABC-F family ATP-binding cassette domain-containing protein [Youxingia wuxianensis]|uniref:ABC-F family ATP-binding cassette domain-containing protein n=1 Tax=Youxingia wuxianensis TaxID=2763678 RepID=A0A926IBF5_9FIRM|nr:ABC-F family ATP-binding cassette domain-containing protein [Youxingia wuxianensis]MBC8584037.1 ABC-F family ATP-binding cassette domain-containing protein [Youxingia wuxianensis]